MSLAEDIALVNKKVTAFSELLDRISSLDDKKKQLWREVYENAVADRQRAFVLFTDLLTLVQHNGIEYAVHGKTLASYLERLAKCNDQLLKLADLISQAEEKSGKIDPDDMFSKIGN